MLIYDKSKEKLYIFCLDFNILILRPIPYGGFEYVENISIFTTDFTINYYKNSDFDFTLLVDVASPEYLQPLHKNLLFLPEKKVIN